MRKAAGSHVRGFSYTLNNPMGITSVNKTVGDLLSAHPEGAIFTVGGATLKVVQDAWFNKTSNSINFSVDIVNVGSAGGSGSLK